jgi:hypothetical protein
MTACGAKTRRGSACAVAAMPNGKCYRHGGATQAGPGASRFIHGRYSKLLSARLLERFTEAQADPELLALRDEIALVDARIADVLQRVDSGESGEAWGKLRDLTQDLEQAIRTGDQVRLVVVAAGLSMIAKGGLKDDAAWREVLQLVGERRVLVESERRRWVQQRQMMTTVEAMTLLAAVVDVVRRHVPDHDALRAISAELRALCAVPEADAAPVPANLVALGEVAHG